MSVNMFDLPITEMIIFLSVIVLYFLAAIMGVLQISSGDGKYRGILTHFISLGLVMEAILLLLRAVELQAVPLTGLFESMIVLTMVFGVTYLVLGMGIRQVWFSSAVTWVIFVLIVLTAVIARPAVEAMEVARKPWVYAHALAMILGGSMIVLAAVTAYVYLLSRSRLKHKKIKKVLGKVPNFQKLERINLFGLKAAFILFTIGLISGVAGTWSATASLGQKPFEWLIDSKILGVVIVWLLLLVVLTVWQLRRIKGKTIALVTLFTFIWVVFTFVGTAILCKTKHDFTRSSQTQKDIIPEQKK